MMFLITMVLASHAAQETVNVRLSAGQRQCIYAMNRKPTDRRYRAPIFDDTAPTFIVKGTNRVLCPHSHELGKPFVAAKEIKCSECCILKRLPAGTVMHDCTVCKKMGYGKMYCTGCTHKMDGTYRKLLGGIKITKSMASQSEGSYRHAFEAPYEFGGDDVRDLCGDHVWRNEESGLLMMRSPISNTYPCFYSHEWIITKWPCQYPSIAASNGDHAGIVDGECFAAFCVKGSVRANAHLPPTEQTWTEYSEKPRKFLTEKEDLWITKGNSFTVKEQDVNEYRISKIQSQADEIAALKAQLALFLK